MSEREPTNAELLAAITGFRVELMARMDRLQDTATDLLRRVRDTEDKLRDE